jgi:hypothetical protein
VELANLGPLTMMLEVSAAAVAAGIVLCSVAVGGAIGAGLALVDAVLRYVA